MNPTIIYINVWWSSSYFIIMLIEIHVFENGAPKGMPYVAPFDVND